MMVLCVQESVLFVTGRKKWTFLFQKGTTFKIKMFVVFFFVGQTYKHVVGARGPGDPCLGSSVGGSEESEGRERNQRRDRAGRQRTSGGKAVAPSNGVYPPVEGFPSQMIAFFFFVLPRSKMYRIEMNLDDEWSAVAVVAKDALDETLAQHGAAVGGDRVRAVEVVPFDRPSGAEDAALREQQDRDYEACLMDDRRMERAKAKEARGALRAQRREEEERQRNRPGLDELRERRTRFYDFQNRRVTRSAAKRMNHK
jgi:hypothetical protein